MYTRRVDVQDGDEAFITEYERRVEHLAGLVHEMFGENRATLLSPVFRELIREQATILMKYHVEVKGRLACDNPGHKPLSLS